VTDCPANKILKDDLQVDKNLDAQKIESKTDEPTQTESKQSFIDMESNKKL